MTLLYIIIGSLLALYVVALAIETFFSFARLTGHNHEGYVDATWEVTHTLLVFAVTMFGITHGSILPEVMKDIFWPLMAFGVAFLLRSILYALIFYARKTRYKIIDDWLFALSHLAMIGSLVFVLFGTLPHLLSPANQPDTSFLWLFIPGFALVLILASIPAFRLYSARGMSSHYD